MYPGQRSADDHRSPGGPGPSQHLSSQEHRRDGGGTVGPCVVIAKMGVSQVSLSGVPGIAGPDSAGLVGEGPAVPEDGQGRSEDLAVAVGAQVVAEGAIDLVLDVVR